MIDLIFFSTDNLHAIYILIIGLGATGILIMTLEDIVNLKSFHNNGILSWKVSRSLNRYLVYGITGKIAGLIFQYPFFSNK